MDKPDFALLEALVAVQGTSGDESQIKQFVLDYITSQSPNWKIQPQVMHGEEFQDALIVVFGQPKTAIFAHLDTIGYTTGYNYNLIKIGGPRILDGTELVGRDSKGAVETELMVIENEDGGTSIRYVLDREIDRGTPLSFRPNFRLSKTYVQSPYMDNRLGVWVALQVAKDLENGILVFSTYEEHGGGSVGFLGRYIQEKFGVRQALIADITWVTEGVQHGKGVAISMRDSGIPRRTYLNRIIELAKSSKIPYQLEVESAGGSDGTMLQKTDLSFDWCFIGAPEDHVHTPDEKVHLKDIQAMVDLYNVLMEKL
jgi:putative aminopeptidase FrvX